MNAIESSSGAAERSRTSEEKIGLALSGGGFRAAFFHIGVLARLAETGILRRVEVLSTVSGGSIVGALYYIHVKKLLESKADRDVSNEDYVEIVLRLERDFREAVGKNIRARAFANVFKNVVMALPSYSRSDRIGDLYDRLLYQPAWERDADGAVRNARPRKARRLVKRQIELRELLIRPPDAGEDFKPDEHNAARERTRVPILMINATSLNTGNNWRFEAVRMGEPQSTSERAREVLRDVDKNRRLEQGYFDERPGHEAITDRQRDFPLGLAVAASACVPMAFHPLSISGLYDGIRVELVDGGVHDNQGVQALFDSGCTHLIVSDASGQMPDLENPSTRIPAVGLRSSSIYGDRIRDEQLVDAYGRPTALMHLRKGLANRVDRPLGSNGGPVSGEPAYPDDVPPVRCADFHVCEEVQRELARVRTDLDCFSEIESFSLMLDGYKMSAFELERADGIPELQREPIAADARRWTFGVLDELIEDPARSPAYLPALGTARLRFFKPLALLPGAPWTSRLAALTPVALIALLLWWQSGAIGDALRDEWRGWAVVLAVGTPLAVCGAYFGTMAKSRAVRLPTDVVVSMLSVALAPPLFLSSWLTIAASRIFLHLGRAERVARSG